MTFEKMHLQKITKQSKGLEEVTKLMEVTAIQPLQGFLSSALQRWDLRAEIRLIL